MQIKRYIMERLTPRTCMLHKAIEGFCCNKTMFLLQPPMKYEEYGEEDEEAWSIKHFEKDRFAVTNGLIYLLKERRLRSLGLFFEETENHEVYFVRIRRDMTLKEISEEIDKIYQIL